MSLIAHYSALAALSVTVTGSASFGTVTPKVFDLSAAPNNLEHAKLPARLMQIVEGGEGRDFHFVWGNSDTAIVTWHLVDRLYWREADSGLGLQSHAPDLAKYIDAYVVMLQGFHEPTTNSRVVAVAILPGVYEYPTGSGVFYAGVECTLDIEQRLHANP